MKVYVKKGESGSILLGAIVILFFFLFSTFIFKGFIEQFHGVYDLDTFMNVFQKQGIFVLFGIVFLGFAVFSLFLY